MGPLNFLKQKLNQGLSDVEQWGSDAGNDVTHALGAVFGGGSAPTAPTQQQTPQQQGQQTFSQAQNPAIQLQANQPQQQNQQTPLKTNLFSPNQGSSVNIANQPQQLNTKLVNYQQPTRPAIPLTGPKQTNNNEPGLFSQFTNVAAAPINVGRGLFNQYVGNNPSGATSDYEQANQQARNNIIMNTGKGVINAGKAAYYTPESLAGEFTTAIGGQATPAELAAPQKGLAALNQSTYGPLVSGPEKIITSNIPGAAQAAQQAGFNPKEGIAATGFNTGMGVLGALFPLNGAGSLAGRALDEATSSAIISNVVKGGGVDGLLSSGKTALTPEETAMLNGLTQTKPPEETPKSQGQTLIDGATPAPTKVEQHGNLDLGTQAEQDLQDSVSNRNQIPQVSTRQLRQGVGVTPDMITDEDRAMAQMTSTTPEALVGTRLAALRNSNGERAALEANANGATLEESTKAYIDATGESPKQAAYRTKIALRQADRAIRPNGRTPNPEDGQHTLPNAEAGDYEQAGINQQRVVGTAEHLNTKAQASLGALSKNDYKNFVDYLEGTQDINKADDPNLVQQAIDDSKKLTDTGNSFDHETGGETPHVDNYFPRDIERTDEEASADRLQTSQELEEELGPKEWNNMDTPAREAMIDQRMGENGYTEEAPKERNIDDVNYGGHRNQKREFATEKEARDAKVNIQNQGDPKEALNRYTKGLQKVVGDQAFVKAAREADIENAQKGGLTQTVRYGKGQKDRLDVSDEGKQALADHEIKAPGKNKLGTAIKKTNATIKRVLISTGIPHAIIIPPRYIGAYFSLKGGALSHLFDGSATAEDLTNAAREGTPKTDNVEFGYRVDSPIHGDKYGAGVSKTPKNPLTKLVYNVMLPKMHDVLLGELKNFLDKNNIDYDSAEARNYGHQINDVLGYSKNGNSAFDQLTFAPSLIKSTARMYGKSVTPGGDIARGGVIGQQLTNQVTGIVSKNISNLILSHTGQNDSNKKYKIKDNFWSTVQQEALHPQVYTPFVNSKQENIRLGIPGQYQAKALSIPLGLGRGANGQIKTSINSPHQMLTNTVNTAKDIASPVLNAGLGAVTNQTYNGTKIRDPNAGLGTQALQTAINSGSNMLPINLQALAGSSVQKHLPQPLQSSINVNKNGAGLTLAANTLGLNPSADITTGQGPGITAYYNAKAAGLKALDGNPEATDAFNAYLDKDVNNKGQKVDHSPQESIGVANLVAGDPQALNALQTFEKSQPNHDPMWDLSPNDLKTFLSYQGTRATDPTKQAIPIVQTGFNNGQGLSGFIKQRDAYYSANQGNFKSTSVVAPGTPTYPNFQGQQSTDYQEYENTIKNGTSQEKSAFLNSHPDVVDAMSQINKYYNAQGVAQGGLAIKNGPSFTPQQQAALTYYDSLPASKSGGNTNTATSGERSAWIKANPGLWAQITNVLAQDQLQSTAQQGAVEQYQGVPITSQYLTGIKQLGSDIAVQNGVASINPALAYTQGSGSGSGSSKSSPLVPLPKVKRPKKQNVKRPPKLRGFRAPHIKKSTKVKVQANGRLNPTKVLHPTQVVKIKA